MTIAMFAGQGSQHQRLGAIVDEWRPDLRRAAAETAGSDPFARLHEGTRWVQPAVFCASLALWARVRRQGVEATAFAGHSLGDVAALVAATAIDERDGLGFVCLRGAAMEAAAAEDPRGEGAMMAVVGPRASELAPELAARCGLSIANDNGPTQIVLSGPVTAWPQLLEAAAAAGLRAVRLPIAGAFHSAAMRPAAMTLRRALAGIEVRPTPVPVISSTSARPFHDPRVELAEAVCAPVRWREVVLGLAQTAPAAWLDCGPSDTLAKLVRKLVPTAEVRVADESAGR